METPDSQQVGKISFFEVYHIPEEECFRVLTNKDDFRMELDIPDEFDGSISDVRNQIYSDVVEEYNEWLMEN